MARLLCKVANGSKRTTRHATSRRVAWALSALTLLLAELGFAGNARAPRIVLDWEPVPQAISYEVEIAREPTFAAPILRTRTKASELVWDASPSIEHYWRVRSLDTSGRAGLWSAPAVIIAPIFRPPALRAPDAERRFYAGDGLPIVELSFEEVPGANEYEVEVALDARFHLRAFRSRTPDLVVVFSPPSTGSYYWRVRGVVGNTVRRTTFSEARAFYVLPARPRLLAPSHGAVIAAGEPVLLRFGAASAARSYRVEVASEAGFSTLIWTREGTDTAVEFTPQRPGCLLWRVLALGERDAQTISARAHTLVVTPPRYSRLGPLATPAARLDLRRHSTDAGSSDTTSPPVPAATPPASHGTQVGFAVGIGAFGAGGLRAARASVGLDLRPAVLHDRLVISAGCGYLISAATFASPGEVTQAKARVHALPCEAALAFVLGRSKLGNLLLGAGANLTTAYVTDGAPDGRTSLSGGASLLVGVERELGPGALFVRASYLRSVQLRGPEVVGANGLTAEGGYRLTVY